GSDLVAVRKDFRASDLIVMPPVSHGDRNTSNDYAHYGDRAHYAHCNATLGLSMSDIGIRISSCRAGALLAKAGSDFWLRISDLMLFWQIAVRNPPSSILHLLLHTARVAAENGAGPRGRGRTSFDEPVRQAIR